MYSTVAEQLTAQFYDWELRGRGWTYHPHTPLELEPPYIPFIRKNPISSTVDDGKHHSVLSYILEQIVSLFKPKLPTEDSFNVVAQPFECTEQLFHYTISFNKGTKFDTHISEQLLLMLSFCQYPISFEIIATSEKISIQLTCRTTDSSLLHNQIAAFFPEHTITQGADKILELTRNQTNKFYITHFGLGEEFMRPVRTIKQYSTDPFAGLLATMEDLGIGEAIIIQVLFKGVKHPWSKSILRSVLDSDGKDFFMNAPEMSRLAKDKVSAPLFGVAMRVLTISDTVKESEKINIVTSEAFVRIFLSEANSIIPLAPEIDSAASLQDVLRRESHITGMLLNSNELATVVHLPFGHIASSKLEKDIRKTKAAPKITEGNSFVIGQNEYKGKVKAVTLPSSLRFRHTHIIGSTGTGKSTLIQHLISQDISLGNGIAVLDPHGDLIENILCQIPLARRKDVILIDPSDRDFPIGFNFLTAHTETEKDILSSDLVAVFKRLSTSWGDQINSVLANAILAFLESKTGGTLVDLRKFLIEKSYRDSFLKTVQDPSIVYYWQKEFPIMKTNSIGPILTRLDTFLRPRLIRNMVAQKKSIEFEHILDSRKILLVKLSQGLIGNENSYLLGTVIVSKIHQAAMARQAKADRKDFFLYIDEFQNFITPSMSAILSGARKYNVGMTLAHQDMQQLVKYDAELASSIVSNAGTRICFRLGDTDAKRFDSGFSYFEQRDLENLSTGQAICRVDRSDYDFSLETFPAKTISIKEAEGIKAEIIAYSRERYATPIEYVEQTLHQVEENVIVEPIKETVVPPVVNEIPAITEAVMNEAKEALVKQKEESEHRLLQNLIKRMAEARGYRAFVEHPVQNGEGRVDVHLEHKDQTIACEVSVTTDVAWELHNIRKCLAAGYDLVVEISNNQKMLAALEKVVANEFDDTAKSKIMICVPDVFFQFLDTTIAAAHSSETVIKGYRVKVEFNPNAENIEERQKSLGQTISDGLKKNNKKKK